jgi:hypothetical protein
MKCDKCGYDDKGTGDWAHVCGPVQVKMPTPVVPDNVIKLWSDPRFQILVEVDRLLDSSKMWAGVEYTYHPIHPVKYRPVAEKIRKAIDDLKTEYGVEE